MHRLALEGANLHRAAYICPPCQLRIALRVTPRFHASRPPRSSYSPRTFATSAAHYRKNGSQNTATKPQSISDDISPTAKGANPEQAAKDIPKVANGVEDAAQKRDVPAGSNEIDAYRQLLHQHQLLSTSVQALRTTQKEGKPVLQKDQQSLQARVETLEEALQRAVSSDFKEDSKYHTSLQNFARSVKNMSAKLDRLELATRTNSKRERKKPVMLGSKKQTGSVETIKTPRQGRLRIRNFYVKSVALATEPDGSARSGSSKSRFARHGLGDLSSDQKQAVLRFVMRMARLHDTANLTDSLRADILTKTSAVFTDRTMADSIVNMTFERIANKQLTNTEPVRGVSFAEAMGHVRMEDALASAETLLPMKPSLTSDSYSDLSTSTLESSKIELRPIEIEQPPVRGLSYGLDRVLFNPGVYRLQDSRSRVYNFDPYLEELIPVQDFNFDLIPSFKTSSKDTKLLSIAQNSGAKYTGSSSSMTGILAQFHFLISRFRQINLQMLSRSLPIKDFHQDFTTITRSPASVFLRLKNGVYAIDSDKEFASTNVLSLLGNSLEKLLTLDKDDYLKYRRDSTETISEETWNAPDTYHYTSLGNTLMRSQLDAHDPRLPGTGMFDLKTRAVFPIRMDVDNYQKGKDYEIKTQFGKFESFEREYLDMLRATMIKYMLQVRIGRMDGIFVAFHNTQRIFGCQYVPLEEIDLALHGQYDRSLGDQEFKLSVQLMNETMDAATKRFPNTSIRLMFRAAGGRTRTHMFIFAEPVTEEEANNIQHKKDEQIAAITEEIMAGKFPKTDRDGRRIVDYSVLGDSSNEPTDKLAAELSKDEDTASSEVGKDVSANASGSRTDITLGETSVTSADTEPVLSGKKPPSKTETEIEGQSLQEASTGTSPTNAESGLTPDRNADSEFLDDVSSDAEAAAQLADSDAPLLVMELKIKNFVNGKPVDRPGFPHSNEGHDPNEAVERQGQVGSNFSTAKGDNWDLHYTLKEVTDRTAAWSLYLSAQQARSVLDPDHKDRNIGLAEIRKLGQAWSKKGKTWRMERDEEERTSGREKVVANDNKDTNNHSPGMS